MKLLEQLFTNNWAFYVFLGCIFIGVSYATHIIIDEIQDTQKAKVVFKKELKKEAGNIETIQQELDRRSKIIDANKDIFSRFEARLKRKTNELRSLERKFTKKIDEKSKSRWHFFDMEHFCDEAQKLNPGWKCPDLDNITNTQDNTMEK